MADVSKIKLPDQSIVNIKDYRIPGVDTTPTSGSSNLITSGGVYQDIEDTSRVVSAALNDLNDRVVDIEDEWVTTEEFSQIEQAVRDTYTKQEIDVMLADLESGGVDNVVTQVKVGATAYNPSNGIVSLPAYPTSLPASDVSSWAKSSTKPTYTASEVGAATENYVDTAVAGIVNSAPTTLDTLNELATALGNDPNFATTVATQIGQKYTKPSTGIPASDLANDVIPYVENFYFVQGSSSQAGNATSGSYLSTKWEGTVPGVSTAVDGLKIAYRVATNTGVSTAGVVLSIDGTNYYPVVIQKNTIVTTHYPVGATVLMVFNSTQTATAYLTSNTKSTVTGCWQIMEYDSNTNTYQRVYVSSDNTEYPITARYSTTSGSSYYAEYGRYSESVTLNPSTNTITAGSFKIANGTSSQFLKADGSVDTNTYALASAVPSAVTESTVSGWGFTKNNGTVTGITMNGASKGTSGVVDLGTVLTSETALSKGTTTGSGNAVTDISVSGHQITLTKGSTFLTSETSLSKGTTSGSGNAVTDISVSGHQITLTKGTTFLTSHQNISGKADLSGAAFTGAVTGTSSGNTAQFRNITISSSEPTSSQGSNGDIWIVV